jgi:Glycosyltransferase family 87
MVPGKRLRSNAPDARHPLTDARFRQVLGSVLLVAGLLVLGTLLIRQASQPVLVGQYGIDFHDYRLAAQRMSAGGSPYAGVMLQGPIPAQGLDRYRYPPILAQLLMPVSGLSLVLDNTLWLIVQSASMFAGVWLAGSAGGLRPSWERALWTALAIVWFLPVFQTLWMGNVSGIVAGLVGLAAYAERRGGTALGLLGLLKGTTGLAAPIALFRDRKTAASAIVASALLVGISLVAAPTAWVDYLRVLPNLAAGSADYATNLAPDQLLGHVLPGLAGLAPFVRLGAVGTGLACLGTACVVARRNDRWATALTLAVAAALLIPSALWYHYLAVLLPLAALAWARATRRERGALVALGGVVTAGIAALWLAAAAAGAMLLVTARVTWDSRSSSTVDRVG